MERAEKRAMAIDLRKEGKTWQEVADTMGYASHKGPQELIKRAIKDTYGKAATEYVEILLERLEALFEDALDGGKQRRDPHWHEQARKVVADMRRMVAADKPAVQHIEHTGTVTTAEDLDAKLAGIATRKDEGEDA